MEQNKKLNKWNRTNIKKSRVRGKRQMIKRRKKMAAGKKSKEDNNKDTSPSNIKVD